MIFGNRLGILHFVSLVLLFSESSSSSASVCEEKCGALAIQYPFHLQPPCSQPHHPEFRISCSYKGSGPPIPVLQLNSHEYRVLSINSGELTIDPVLFDNCTFPNLQSFNLSGSPFTISSRNVLQLHNCSIACHLNCSVANLNLGGNCHNFEPICCQPLDPRLAQIDSYSPYGRYFSPEAFTGGYSNLVNFSTRFNCTTFTSWTYASTNLSIDAEYGLKLSWSLHGVCSKNVCSRDADCHPVSKGYYCQCKPGYWGDGYVAGIGCNPESVASSVVYNGTTLDGCASKSSSDRVLKLAVITAGLIAIATIVAAVVLACAVVRSRHSFALRQDRKADARGFANLLSIAKSEIFSYRELEKATKGFAISEKLGNGACGTVYAGKLEDNRRVAVKRIHALGFQGCRQIVNEVNVLSKVQHRNLVRLLGFCIEGGDDPLLVFEFVSNGTLAEHLQRERGDGLDWLTRLTVAAETADALAYLHSLDPPIYHRDVKSRNILLDEEFNTKIADFGLSRLGPSVCDGSHISTIPQGTPGYVDPEYHQNYHLSDKSDVYSFGVVLIEIVTALKPVDFSRDKKEVNLSALALAKIGNGTLDEIIDKFLEVEKMPNVWTMVHRVAELAFRCLAFDKDARPTMAEVLEELLRIRGANGSPALLSHMSASMDMSSSSASCRIEEARSAQIDRFLRCKRERVSRTSVQPVLLSSSGET